MPPDLETASAGRLFRHGLTLPLRGLRTMARERALWPYVATPVAVTTALLLGAWWLALQTAPQLVDTLFARPADAAGWLGWARLTLWRATWLGVHVLVLALFSVLSWFVGSILASPVYDRLSARVEHLVLGRAEEPFDARLVAGDVVAGVSHSLLALVLYLSLACPLVVLGIVPILGPPAELMLGTLVSAWFLAREVMDYATSRRRLGFGEKLGLLRRHRAVTLGLGLSTFALLWIPLANFLSMPAAVIGGTLLCCELEGSGLLRPRPGRLPSEG